MYEAIRRPAQPKRGRTLTLPLLLCGLVIGAGVLLFVWAGRYQLQFRSFIQELGEVTTEARQKGSYSVRMGEETIDFDDEALSRLFYRLSQAGSGRPGDAPVSEPEVVVDYGGGITLEIWIVPLVNPGNEWTEGPFFRYTGREGQTYCYDTDQLRPDSFLRLFY